MVELFQHLLHVGEFFLDLFDDNLQQLEPLLFCDVICTRLVLLLAIMLDLLTRVFDFCEAKGGRRAFEEVAKLRERLEVSLLAGMLSVVRRCRELWNV